MHVPEEELIMLEISGENATRNDELDIISILSEEYGDHFDPDKDTLIEPTWLLKKFCLLNDIDKEMKKRDTYQGKYT